MCCSSRTSRGEKATRVHDRYSVIYEAAQFASIRLSENSDSFSVSFTPHPIITTCYSLKKCMLRDVSTTKHVNTQHEDNIILHWLQIPWESKTLTTIHSNSFMAYIKICIYTSKRITHYHNLTQMYTEGVIQNESTNAKDQTHVQALRPIGQLWFDDDTWY